MAKQYRWVRAKPITKDEKAEITAACERLIAESLKPRFLPEIRVTEFNYPIDIFGRWRGAKDSFVVRFRSHHPDRLRDEYDSAFARLDLDETSDPRRFDVMWFRHTGRWWPLHREVPLDEALRLIETEPHLRPPIWPT